jgi:hypothetical protein
MKGLPNPVIAIGQRGSPDTVENLDSPYQCDENDCIDKDDHDGSSYRIHKFSPSRAAAIPARF